MALKDEEILGLWSELFVGNALALRAIEEEIAEIAPLTINEYDVMLCISRSSGQKIRFSALADASVYTKSGITRIMKRLEHEGFVKREGCPEDKRGSFAVVTKSGTEALQKTWQHYSAAVLNILSSCFSTSEAQTVRELLGRLVEKLLKPELVQIRTPKKISHASSRR